MSPEEIQHVEKFVAYCQKRMSKLITINEAQDFSKASAQQKQLKDVMMSAFHYTGSKIGELFVDYKNGKEPDMFGIPL